MGIGGLKGLLYYAKKKGVGVGSLMTMSIWIDEGIKNRRIKVVLGT